MGENSIQYYSFVSLEVVIVWFMTGGLLVCAYDRFLSVKNVSLLAVHMTDAISEVHTIPPAFGKVNSKINDTVR